MASKDAVKKGLEVTKRRFEVCAEHSALQGFHKRVQFVFPDIRFTSTLKIMEGKVTRVKYSWFTRPDIVLSMASDTFLAIQRKEITGRTALAQGKIHLTGKVGDLLVLEACLANI